MDTSDYFTIVIAFFALVVSILTYGQGAINQIINYTETTKANAIAQKALDISSYELKAKLVPIINTSYNVLVAVKEESESDFILLSIYNSSSGKIKITEVTLLGDFEIERYFKTPPPADLLFNNPLEMQLRIRNNARKRMEEQALELEDVNDPIAVIPFIDIVDQRVKKMRITVQLTNQLDISYFIRIIYDHQQNAFIGTPIEVQNPQA